MFEYFSMAWALIRRFCPLLAPNSLYFGSYWPANRLSQSKQYWELFQEQYTKRKLSICLFNGIIGHELWGAIGILIPF
jgi:hypothetical protein